MLDSLASVMTSRADHADADVSRKHQALRAYRYGTSVAVNRPSGEKPLVVCVSAVERALASAYIRLDPDNIEAVAPYFFLTNGGEAIQRAASKLEAPPLAVQMAPLMALANQCHDR